MADILSVLAMTYSDNNKRETLHFRKAGSNDPIESWGHEYAKHLALEIIHEFEARQEKEEPTSDLLTLGLELVPFFMKHNAEADACDLLIELESLDLLPDYVEKDTYARVCRYICRFGCFV